MFFTEMLILRLLITLRLRLLTTLQLLDGHMMDIRFMVHMDMWLNRVVLLPRWSRDINSTYKVTDHQPHFSQRVSSSRITLIVSCQMKLFLMLITVDSALHQSSLKEHMHTLQPLIQQQLTLLVLSWTLRDPYSHIWLETTLKQFLISLTLKQVLIKIPMI